MAITIQQFDFINSLLGEDAALTAAEQAGGITGNRDAGPTQSIVNQYGGASLGGSIGGATPGAVASPGSTSLPAADWYGDVDVVDNSKKDKPDVLAVPESQKIANWINDLINGRTGLGNNQGAVNPVTTESLMKSLSDRLGRTLTAKEFTEIVLPSIPQAWRPQTPAAGFPTVGSIKKGGEPIDTTLPFDVGDTGFDFAAQDPSTAFTRYLSTMSNAPSQGTFGRNVLENRGQDLARLATAFGYGINNEPDLEGNPPDPRAQGESYFPFYSKYAANDPSWADIQTQARSVQTSLGTQFPAVGKPYDEVMLGRYGDPESGQAQQLALTQGALSTQVNPFLQGGLEQQLRRRFAQQQATNTNQNWLDYAIANGLI